MKTSGPHAGIPLRNHKFHRTIKDIIKEQKGKEPPVPEETASFITLFFRSESEIIDPFSAAGLSDEAIINPAVINYLESRVRELSLKKRVTIEIEYGGKLPDDPFLPEKLIKKNLVKILLDSHKRYFKIMAGSLVLALAGIGILAFIDRIPFFRGLYAFNELFVVISWVFLWNFVDLFFFQGFGLRVRRMKLLQIYFAEYKIKAID